MSGLKPFAMPKWGIEMSEGTIAEWRVREGEPFAKGDVIALIETDKITNEVEAEADGCMVRLIAKEQQAYPVGALLAVQGPQGADSAAVDAFVAGYVPPSGSAASEQGESSSSDEPAPEAAKTAGIADDVAISPSARRAAEAAGLSVDGIEGSGRTGRITRQDVDKALAGSRAPVLKGPIEAPGQEEAFASPLARRLAVLNGIDLATVTGTGPRGRVRKSDVLAHATQGNAGSSESHQEEANAPSGEVEILKMSPIRKTIARRLTAAKQTIPHIYLRRRVRVDRLLAAREAAGKPGSINDYLIRACAIALREVPDINVQVQGEEIHRFPHADIAIAVATDKGLITPIVTGAELLSVAQIAERAGALAERARQGKLQPDQYQGGSFCISNLGGFGVEEFDAIINPPQGAILAVGKARLDPVEDDGAIRIVPMMALSLSCDHRAIDGADGARFLEALAKLIEEPERL